MLHAVVRSRSAGSTECVDRRFQSACTRGIDSCKVPYDLGIVVRVSVFLIGIVAHCILLITGELDDGDLAVGRLGRHGVNEAVDGGFQGVHLSQLRVGVELGADGIRRRTLGGQAGASFTPAVSQVVLVIL